MWDRQGSADDTNLQSLPGRACGYNKKGTPFIVTCKRSYENYEKYWMHDDCVQRVEEATDAERLRLDGKMKGIETQRKESAGEGEDTEHKTKLGVSAVFAGPCGTSDGTGVRVTKRKMGKEEDDKWVLYREEFDTLEQANLYLKKHGCRQKHTFKRNDSGFILSSTTKTKSVLSYDTTISEMEGWAKTATFDIRGGKTKASRMYVCYKDIADARSVVYIVRIIQKI